MATAVVAPVAAEGASNISTKSRSLRIVVFQGTSKRGNSRHQLFSCSGIQTRRGQDASENVQRLCAQRPAALGQSHADLALIRWIAAPLDVAEDFQALKQRG